MLMGGRAAEMLLGEDISTGAADDLAKATDISRGMVLRFGMDEKLGRWRGIPSRAVPEPAWRFLAAAAVLGRDGARDRCGGAGASRRGTGAGGGDPDDEPRGIG